MTLEKILECIQQDRMDKFYRSTAWRKLRKIAITQQNYECQMCKAEGRVKKAQCVHHVKEVREFPSLALDINNLMCLCYYHHNVAHEDKLKDYRESKTKDKWNDEKW